MEKISLRPFAFISVLFLLCTMPSITEAEEDKLMEELRWLRAEAIAATVVTASRHEESILESPSAISVITHEEIIRSPANTIPELLQYVVGMDGYTKTYTDMDIAARGSAYDETSKMLVLMDGQEVNVTPYSGIQWPTLPLSLSDIERIEVMRGPGSAIYGADALVGVINIFTRESGKRKDTLSVSYGEKGTSYNTAHFSHTFSDNLSFALTGGFIQTEGRGERQTPEDKSAAPNYEIKDWAEIILMSYRLDYKRSRLKFFSEGGYTTDGEGYNPSPGDRTIDKSYKNTLILNNQMKINMENDELMLRIGLRNLDQENYRYGNSAYAYKYRVRKGLGIDSDIQYTFNGLPGQTIIAGSNISYLEASRNIANSIPYTYDETDDLLSAYLQDEVRFLNNNILWTGSLRYDKWNKLSGVVTPRLALNIYLLDKKANIRLSGGTSFRRPGFDENYYFVTWPTGWFKGAVPNAVTQQGENIKGSLLKPENAVSYEIGIRYMPEPKFLLDLGLFHQKVTDTIGYIVYYSNPSTNELNIGHTNISDEVTTTGIEAETKKYLTSDIYAFLNYTYQYAEIASGGIKSRWKNAPENKISGGIFYSGFADIDLRSRYVSEVTYQEVANIPVGSYYTIDLAVSKKISKSGFVKLSAINLLNNIHYEYPIYTAIDRKISLTLQYDF
ncbi:MAG: TonB-dependent receptor [Nitrospirae bacterium]|nr:TonB-dependent receptor [Nitrospirota bacterium]